MSCKICGKNLLVYGINNVACNFCINVKHFKCTCSCGQLFSYNELRGYGIRKIKCTNIKKIICMVCKRSRHLISKNERKCISCIQNSTVNRKLLDRRIILRKELVNQIKMMNEEIEELENEVNEALLGLVNIKPPSSDIVRFGNLTTTLAGYVEDIDHWVFQKIGPETELLSIEESISILTKNSTENDKYIIDYYAAKTFLLCCLRPEIQRYIQKPVQKIICMYILSEFLFL